MGRKYDMTVYFPENTRNRRFSGLMPEERLFFQNPEIHATAEHTIEYII